MKKIDFLFIFLFFSPSTLSGGQVVTNVSMEEYPYSIVEKDGFSFIDMENTEKMIVPGAPLLPVKNVLIAVPPLTRVTSVEIFSTNQEVLEGTYNIRPAPPMMPSLYDKKVIQEIMEEYHNNYDKIYSSATFYPSDAGSFLHQGQKRELVFACVSLFPFQYNPVSKKLIYNRNFTIIVNYDELSGEDRIRAERWMKYRSINKDFIEQFLNAEDAKRWYMRENNLQSMASFDSNYVIITTPTIESSGVLNSFINWKESIGNTVAVVNTQWISDNFSGEDLQEKIRNFLADSASSWGIEYVLFIGHQNDIPMRKCYPYPYNHSPSEDKYWPWTDYYYADLIGDWDADGDGYYGERGDDNVDFYAEVYVGRIPTSDISKISTILLKSIEFENGKGKLWKHNTLLLGAFSNFQNEDNSGRNETDGATLMEEMKTDIFNTGWNNYTMYEKEGVDPSDYPCDESLTHTNVVNRWSNNDYGIVTWWAHGGKTTASRKIWSSDADGDGVPDSTEMDFQKFFESSDCSQLDESHPSVVFLCSCHNGYTEDDNNLGKSLIENGAVGTVSSSRISWYTIGWQNESWGGNASIDYYFYHYLINQNQKMGEALFSSKEYYWSHFNFFLWGWKINANLYDFNLFGDPALIFEGISPSLSYQPDEMIKNQGEDDSVYLKDNIYENPVFVQIKEQVMDKGDTAIYIVKIENDGENEDTILVKGTGSGMGWLVSYYDAETGGNDITDSITGSDGFVKVLAKDSSFIVRVEVLSQDTTLEDSSYEVVVRATSLVDTTKVDGVKAIASLLYHQPDEMIKNEGEDDTEYLTDNLYEDSANVQVKSQDVQIGDTAIFIVKIENDGNVEDTFSLKGTPGDDNADSTGWIVKYFNLTDSSDITSSVTGEGWKIGLPPDSSNIIKVEIIPQSNVPAESIYAVYVRAISMQNTDKVDEVKAEVKALSGIASSFLPEDFILDLMPGIFVRTSPVIKFGVPVKSHVTLLVYDVTGRVVEKPIDKKLKPGYYRVSLDLNKNKLSTGIYFIELVGGQKHIKGKILIVR